MNSNCRLILTDLLMEPLGTMVVSDRYYRFFIHFFVKKVII